MARPESHADIDSYEKSRQWASFSIQEFIDLPDVVSAYAAFVRAAQRQAKSIVVKDGVVSRLHSTTELDEILKRKQDAWDRTRARYNAVRQATENHDLGGLEKPWNDTESWTLRYHAENEGLPVFDLIHSDVAVREIARREAKSAVSE